MNRLGPRLFLAVTLVVLAITAAYDLLRLQRARQGLLGQLEREASLVARAVEGPLRFWMRTGDRQELEGLLADIRNAKGATCVGVYDLSGRLDVASREEAGGSEDWDGCAETLAAGTISEAALSQWSPLGTFRILAPLTRDGAQIATLKLVLPSTVLSDPLRRQRDVILMERALFLAAIGITLGLAIAVLVSRPIRRLMRGTEEIGRGNLETRIPVRSRTEIGDLARAFNRMAESLREARRRTQAEEDRRIALERHIRHAEKLAVIGQLASELAHEVGTPLNVISGRARVLRRQLADGDPRTENLKIIGNQVERISRVIKRFLTMARPPRMQRERVAFAPIVREVAAFLAPELRKRQVRLVLSVPNDLPTVTADPDGLSQVLLNLLMNATAAVSPGGRIEVAAVPAGDPTGDGPGSGGADGIAVRVSDDGHGIAPELLPRIFEPFFSTKREEGTGLGLSICRDIVRDHGGRITAESRPGEGTTVRLWLPIAPPETRDEPTPDPAH
ncbi:MAG: HAMP domain-containing protein [candidate division NC10 bacterium]|nr:HAMP domain-containing protein [candidate division NC10 bacterium]